MVLADVGDQSVVGAGSVVTKPVRSACMTAGNPARVLRDRTKRSGRLPTTDGEADK